MKAWQEFFDFHAKDYEKNEFTKATEVECAFLSELLPLKDCRKVADVGCGTGRHSIGLAMRGYEVTGFDISEGMLEVARSKARIKDLEVDFRRVDASLPFASEMCLEGLFDAALCLCEGSLGLIGSGDDPAVQALAVLGNISSLLRPGGRAVITVLSAMRTIRMYGPEDIAAGRFDPVNMVEWHSLSEVVPGVGEDIGRLVVGEKGFTGGEVSLMACQCGMQVEHVWGGTAGNWGSRQVDPDEYEIMVTAVKRQLTA